MNKKRIGHDPLAWMVEENHVEPSATSASESSSEDSETLVQPLPTLQLPVTQWVTLELPPILTLSQLDDLKNQLHQYIGQRVQINGAPIERIDTAALQLLFAFMHHPQITAGWVNPSVALCVAARLLGMSGMLGLPEISSENS